MAKFDKATVMKWSHMAETWVYQQLGTSLEMIKEGRDAWTIAHRCGITTEAYKDRTVTDGHIQTALQTIFVNAVFKDRKVY